MSHFFVAIMELKRNEDEEHFYSENTYHFERQFLAELNTGKRNGRSIELDEYYYVLGSGRKFDKDVKDK